MTCLLLGPCGTAQHSCLGLLCLLKIGWLKVSAKHNRQGLLGK
jgi:hypothetical protein